MTDNAQSKGPMEEALAELLATMTPQNEGAPSAAEPDLSGVSATVEARLQALTQAVSQGWPTIEELRRLPASDFSTLVRELGVVIDRLTGLRVELLSGRGPLLR